MAKNTVIIHAPDTQLVLDLNDQFDVEIAIRVLQQIKSKLPKDATQLKLPAPSKKKPKRAAPDTVIFLGKKRYSGTGAMGDMLSLFQKLEGTHAVGLVTREIFRDAIIKKGAKLPLYMRDTGIHTAIKAGYLEYGA